MRRLRRSARGPRPPGWKGRNEIAIRLVTLMRILAARRWMPPLQELARELQVHPRTVRRDLAAIQAARVPLPAPLRAEVWNGEF